MTTSNKHFDYFENKEHYLTFRKAWAVASKTKTLTGAHHLMYNILRGKPAGHGFTFKTSPRKIENGHALNAGFVEANQKLRLLIQAAKTVVEETKDNVICKESRKEKSIGRFHHLERLLAAFDGALTVEMLAAIELDKADEELLFHDYGKGKQLADLIREGNVPSIEDWYAHKEAA